LGELYYLNISIENQGVVALFINQFKIKFIAITLKIMIYGFAYLLMVLAITFIWVFIAIIKKPDFIKKYNNFKKLF